MTKIYSQKTISTFWGSALFLILKRLTKAIRFNTIPAIKIN